MILDFFQESSSSARSNFIPIFLKKCATQDAPLVLTTPVVTGEKGFLYFVESNFDYRLNLKGTLSLSDTRVFDTVCKFIVSVIDTKGKFTASVTMINSNLGKEVSTMTCKYFYEFLKIIKNIVTPSL